MTALLAETARDLQTRLDEELKQRQGERLQRQVVRSLVSSADVLAGIILKVWKGIHETLEVEGMEGLRLARQCQLVLDGIDWMLPAYERFLAHAAASGLTPEEASIPDLEAKLPALREARPQVAAALALATRPARPVDGATLTDSRAAIDRAGFVTLDEEYLARLRAGEDF